MKKLISIIMIVCIMAGLAGSASAIDAQETTMATSIAAAAGNSSYIANIFMQVKGRAGWASADGAKGPVFEVMFKDLENLKGIKTRDIKAVLSESSIDPIADVVKKNNAGKVIEQYQLKDGTSDAQLRKILKQVGSEKYKDAKMVGTKETAKLYNEMAAEAGIEQTMINSGISTETTASAASKVLQYSKNPKVITTIKACGKTSGFGAIMGALAGLAESMQKKDDLYKSLSNMSVDASEGAITMALYPVVVDGITVLLITAGVPAATAATAPIVIGVLGSTATGYALYKAEEAMDVKTVVANLLRKAGETVVKAGSTVKTTIKNADIPGHAADISIKAIELPVTLVAGAAGACAGLYECISEDIKQSKKK